MENIEVFEVIGKHAVTAEDGQLVYEKIYPKLLAGDFITLDFAGVVIFSSAFFNYSIGQLMKSISPEEFKLVNMQNLTSEGQKLLNQVINNHNSNQQKTNFNEENSVTVNEISVAVNVLALAIAIGYLKEISGKSGEYWKEKISTEASTEFISLKKEEPETLNQIINEFKEIITS